jgi:ribose-phosphate pyrophosphokinase
MWILSLPGAEPLGTLLARRLAGEHAPLQVHRFPDGESLVRFPVAVQGRAVVLAACLDHPDRAALPLLFAADAARDLGATEVGLVAPYLPYMRQDNRFRTGEAVTSRTFARLLSASLDYLLTVDPHLHRWHSLDQIYTIPAQVVPAASAIADWLRREVPQPVLVGPDAESAQWVRDVAQRVGAPWTVLTKERFGDRDVQVRMETPLAPEGRTPVLVDDIISTGHTMMAAAELLRAQGWSPAIAIGVHALFDAAAHQAMLRSGIQRVVSCDSVAHPSNGIALGPLLAEALAQRLA